MNNPSAAVPESKNSSPKLIWTFPDHDDDEDDADYGDDDESDESAAAAPPHERWFSHSGFGSLAWWSRL